MRDKDLDEVLRRMAPLIDAWHFTDLPTPRAASAAGLAERHAALGIAGPGPVSVSLHPSPAAALDAALEASDPTDRIVVFGSFYTVGGVLASGPPRLRAPHLP